MEFIRRNQDAGSENLPGNSPQKKKNPVKNVSRRRILKGLAGIPILSLVPGTLKASETSNNYVQQELKNLKGQLPTGKLGNLTVSRMIMGCNLMINHAHARDLIYTDRLIKAYNTEEKIITTLQLAEQSGINTLVNVTEAMDVVNKYKKEHNSKLQTIAMAGLIKNDLYPSIQLIREKGADAIYIHGRVCDAYIRDKKYEEFTKVIEYIRSLGFQAGVGAHCLETIQECEKLGIPSDFYMKTFHSDKYWSALPEENREQYIEIGPSYVDHNKYCDNMWDLHPEKTVEFMKGVTKPLIAFKILAAGAIHPKTGFRYAFENGADFICVGMFDFQVVDDVNTAIDVLADTGKRERKWFS
jgi:hypothetical protein